MVGCTKQGHDVIAGTLTSFQWHISGNIYYYSLYKHRILHGNLPARVKNPLPPPNNTEYTEPSHPTLQCKGRPEKARSQWRPMWVCSRRSEGWTWNNKWSKMCGCRSTQKMKDSLWFQLISEIFFLLFDYDFDMSDVYRPVSMSEYRKKTKQIRIPSLLKGTKREKQEPMDKSLRNDWLNDSVTETYQSKYGWQPFKKVL